MNYDTIVADRSAMTLKAALSHLENALQLLDDGLAPGDIGAHVDLAIHRLRETLEKSGASANGDGSMDSDP